MWWLLSSTNKIFLTLAWIAVLLWNNIVLLALIIFSMIGMTGLIERYENEKEWFFITWIMIAIFIIFLFWIEWLFFIWFIIMIAQINDKYKLWK